MALFKASNKASTSSTTSSTSSSSAAPGRVGSVIGPAFADLRERRYPWVLVGSVVSWVLLGVTLLVSRIGQPTTTVDDPTQSAVQNNGGQIAPTAQDQWFVPLMPWLGVVVVIAAAVLFLGYGVARLVLAALGILAVVALAEAAQWQAVVAALFVVVGAALSLLIPAHRYLGGIENPPRSTTRSPESAADDTASGRTIS